MIDPKHIDYHLLTPVFFHQVVALGNAVHGDNYLTMDSLNQIYQKGWHNAINASFVAVYNRQVVGFRLTFAHSQWQPDKWCTPSRWTTDSNKVCYFKCNTVDPRMQGCGVGSELLRLSSAQAKAQGAVAGLAHIWLASPGNSAFKYFSKNGGELIRKHPDKWLYAAKYENYDCPVCPSLCHCIAAEMLLKF